MNRSQAIARIGLKELLRTNDMTLISFVEATLKGVGIQMLVLDANVSILEGSVGAIPRRLVVGDEDLVAARRTLREAGLGDELEARP